LPVKSSEEEVLRPSSLHKKQGKKPERTTHLMMRPSLARVLLVAFVILELVFSVAIYTLYWGADQRTDTAETTPVKTSVRDICGPILALTDGMRTLAQRIAAHPQTIQALEKNSEPIRQAQLANLQALYPDAVIQIVPADNSLSGNFYMHPLSAVHLRQVVQDEKRQSEGNITSARFIVTTVQAVTEPETQRVLGFVVVDRELGDLQALFSVLPLNGTYAELQQSTANGSPVVLLQRGNEALKTQHFSQLLDLPGTAWRLVVWSKAVPATVLASVSQRYLLVWGVGSLVLLIIIAGLHYSLRQSLLNDMDTFLTLFSDVRHFRLRKRYGIALKDLQETFDLMYRLGKLMVGKQQQVANIASLDHLSQVNNRRAFETKQRELYKTLAEGWAHSLLILDIDNFKYVNDTYGHDAGDMLIVKFGKALKDNLRSSDFIARLGGDEFCVIFPNTPLKKGVELAERLRENMPREVELTPGVIHSLKWSGGLSEYRRNDTSENMALSRADNALLEAKRQGRNRTKIAA
jgi:diguanylate cyclase (GGDEF)-like protein